MMRDDDGLSNIDEKSQALERFILGNKQALHAANAKAFNRIEHILQDMRMSRGTAKNSNNKNKASISVFLMLCLQDALSCLQEIKMSMKQPPSYEGVLIERQFEAQSSYQHDWELSRGLLGMVFGIAEPMRSSPEYKVDYDKGQHSSYLKRSFPEWQALNAFMIQFAQNFRELKQDATDYLNKNQLPEYGILLKASVFLRSIQTDRYEVVDALCQQLRTIADNESITELDVKKDAMSQAVIQQYITVRNSKFGKGSRLAKQLKDWISLDLNKDHFLKTNIVLASSFKAYLEGIFEELEKALGNLGYWRDQGNPAGVGDIRQFCQQNKNLDSLEKLRQIVRLAQKRENLPKVFSKKRTPETHALYEAIIHCDLAALTAVAKIANDYSVAGKKKGVGPSLSDADDDL